MISRRNIRVKVMQLLYIIETAEAGAKLPKPVQVLKKQLDLSNELFVYLLYYITEVARYAETSAFNRAARNLPSNEDLNVNTKIAGNSLLWEIIESDSFKEALEVFKPQNIISKDLMVFLFDIMIINH
jgi:N utilization substance protein B